MDLAVFTHFQTIAVRLYGNIPLGKGDDDGTMFSLMLKQSRFPAEYRMAKWEQLRDAVEKYKVRVAGHMAVCAGIAHRVL